MYVNYISKIVKICFLKNYYELKLWILKLIGFMDSLYLFCLDVKLTAISPEDCLFLGKSFVIWSLHDKCQPFPFWHLWGSVTHSSLGILWETVEQPEFISTKSQPTTFDQEVLCMSAHLGDVPGGKWVVLPPSGMKRQRQETEMKVYWINCECFDVS